MLARQATAAEPEIHPGTGTTAELQAERERLQRERADLHVSTIEPETGRATTATPS